MKNSTINADLDQIMIFKDDLHKGIYILENSLEEVHPYINEITTSYDTLITNIEQKLQAINTKIDTLEEQIHEYISTRDEITNNDTYLDIMYQRKGQLEHQYHQVYCYLRKTQEIFNDELEFILVKQKQNENTITDCKSLLKKSDQILTEYCNLLEKSKQVINNRPETPISQYTVTPKTFSGIKKRIAHCPSENSSKGSWSGLRGNSIFIPSNKKVQSFLKEKEVEGIEYKNGIPDFSNFCIYQNTSLGDFTGIVEIGHMIPSRQSIGYGEISKREKQQMYQYGSQTELGNYEQADIELGKKLNKNPRDITNFRKENKLTWHECNDMYTMQLVPTIIHSYFKHLGGTAEANLLQEAANEDFK